jgi:LysM repeat protein
MKFWHRTVFGVLAIGLSLALGGCTPSGSGTDDEKEPHFMLGQSRVNARDFPGAIEAFEESLEANPHSAAAHFQLAMLYENDKEANPVNPAAAIYHYQQYLRFDPKASNAEVVNQHIYTCKQQLAADVLPLPSAPAVQQQLQQLADTNRFLSLQLDYYMRQLAALQTNPPPARGSFTPLPPANPVVSSSRPPAVNPRPAAARARTHTVAARETLAAIARNYKVSLTALLAANPGLNPKKMRVGQVINLPPS